MALFKDILNEEMKKNNVNKQTLNENNTQDKINIGGIIFTNVHMLLDDYAKSIGAIPYHESKISKL